jgi:hypothetical protein
MILSRGEARRRLAGSKGSAMRGTTMVMAAFVLAAGCGETVIDGIDRASSTELNGSKGPWGQCTYASEDEIGPSVCPDRGPNGEELTCTGGYQHRTFEDSPSLCEAWATCEYRCDDDADCPLPGSGSIAPACVFDTCILPCDDGGSCPDGMVCFDGNGSMGPGRCEWMYEGCPPGY